MTHHLKKLMGQTAVYGLSSIVGRFLNYLLVPLYTHLFLPAEYGVVTEFAAYTGFLFVLLTYGMETAFFRYAQSEKNTDKVFSTALSPLFISSLLFIFGVIFFSQKIADILQYPNNTEYVIWFAVIIGVDAFTAIPFAKLRHENKALKFASFKFINIGLNIGLNLIFLLLLPYLYEKKLFDFINKIYNPEIRIGYIFISNLIASVVTMLLFIPDFIKIKYTFSRKLLKQMIIYALPLLIAGLAGMVNEVIDRVLLKYLTAVPENTPDATQFTLAQIGIYGANYKLSILMTLFVQAFRYAAEPFFFSHQNEKNAKKTYADLTKFFTIFGLVIFLGITLYIDIAKYFINSNYWEGLKIVPILLAANLFLGISYNLSVWYKLTDKTKYGAYLALGGAFITIIINILLIPVLGYTGSAWATFECYFSIMLASFLLGQKFYPIAYDLKTIFSYSISAFLIFFLNLSLDFNSIYIKLIFNSLLFVSFIIFVSYKEKILSKLIKRKV